MTSIEGIRTEMNKAGCCAVEISWNNIADQRPWFVRAVHNSGEIFAIDCSSPDEGYEKILKQIKKKIVKR